MLRARRQPREAGDRAAQAKAERATAGELADALDAACAKEAIDRTAAREFEGANMMELDKDDFV